MLPLIVPPEKICILRLSALGDVCNLVPAVRAIQKKWPQTQITWITGKAEHSLLSGLTGVEFVVYDKKTGLKGMRSIWKQLKHRRFDVLLHAQQALRGSVLSLGLNADIRLGYDKDRAKDWQWLFTNARLAPRKQDHVLQSFMDFARALGVNIPETPRSEDLNWDIPIPQEAYAEARKKCSFTDSGNSQLNQYFVLSPCSTQRARNFRSWTIEGYAGLIDAIFKRYGLPCVLTGGRTEQEQFYASEIQSLVSAPTINLVGKTSIKGLLAVIENSEFTVAPDSGPVHIANAVGTPVIGIFATTNPDRAGPFLWRDYVANGYPKAVRSYLHKDISEVRWGQRVRFEEAMSVIGLDDVLVQVEHLLGDVAADLTRKITD